MSDTGALSREVNAAPGTGIVFFTGCGRSGTTILGSILDRRPDIRYLNDNKRDWVEAIPTTDIWTEGRVARLVLGAADATSDARIVLDRLERHRRGAQLIIDKLPINNFRLGLLRALAPGARFINMRRHGVEVARSLARKIEAGEWYGEDDRKWQLLVEYAESRGLREVAASCETAYDRGLLEWRLSVEAAAPHLEAMDPRALIAVTYEQLLADPGATTRRIEDFLDLPPDPAAARWAAENLARRHPAATDAPIPASTERIAGETLRRFGYRF